MECIPTFGNRPSAIFYQLDAAQNCKDLLRALQSQCFLCTVNGFFKLIIFQALQPLWPDGSHAGSCSPPAWPRPRLRLVIVAILLGIVMKHVRKTTQGSHPICCGLVAVTPNNDRDAGSTVRPFLRNHVPPGAVDLVRKGKDITVELWEFNLVPSIALLYPH